MARGNKRIPQLRNGRNPLKCGVKRGKVARRERQRRAGMGRAKPPKPANIACNDRNACSPRLKNDYSERLVAARQYKRVGASVFGDKLRTSWLQGADNRKPTGDAKLCGAGLELRPVVRLGDGAYEANARLRMSRKPLDEHHLVLLAVDAGDAEER